MVEVNWLFLVKMVKMGELTLLSSFGSRLALLAKYISRKFVESLSKGLSLFLRHMSQKQWPRWAPALGRLR